MTFQMQIPEGFNFRSTVASHGWVCLPPFGWESKTGELARPEWLPGGRVARIAVRQDNPAGLSVRVLPEDLPSEDVHLLRGRVVRMLRLMVPVGYGQPTMAVGGLSIVASEV